MCVCNVRVCSDLKCALNGIPSLDTFGRMCKSELKASRFGL